MSFIDFVMVSDLGAAAQAAISPSTILLYVFACLGMGMAQSVQAFVSQSEGRNEPGRVGAYVWQAIWIGIAAAVLTAPAALTVDRWFPLLARFGDEPADVVEQQVKFLQWGLWAIGPMVAGAALECFWNGARRPIIDFIAVLVSLVTLVIGNYLLIYGNFGFPRMGIAGSGVATLLAWSVRLVVLVIPLCSREINRRYGLLSGMGLRLREMGEILRLGGPIALQWLVDIGAWLVFLQLIIPPYGKEAMAAANIVIQFMHLSFMPCLGIGMALTTQVGNEVGAGRPDMAIMRVRVARRLILSYMGAMALVFVFGGGPLASLLAKDQNVEVSDAVIRIAGYMAMWAALFQIFDGLCIVYSFASRGAGDTRVPALLFFVCCWAIFVGGGLALREFAPAWRYHGPWAACAAYIVVLGLLLMWRFHSEKWRKINIFASGGVAPSAGH
jgi:MATE family multidrug resistance protein